MNAPAKTPRNLGPVWGMAFLLAAEQWWPRWLFWPLLQAGTWVALPFMPVQRAHSRAYLTAVLGRPPRLIEMWRHFFALVESIILKLRVGRGVPVRCVVDPTHLAEWEALIKSGRPALFGTFHFGDSDLLGFLLSQLNRKVSILRQRVGNSDDTRLLGAQYTGVSFLWINNPAHVMFDVKSAIEAGDSLALKCDRLDFSAKNEPFNFLGAPRIFPFTIYHLAVLFHQPVVFCTAIFDYRENCLRVFSSAVFIPDPAAGRPANLATARAHFQAVLAEFDILVRRHPFLWFNFLPLNPEVPAAAAPSRAA